METYVVELEGTELDSFALTVPRATRSVDTRQEYRRGARACPGCDRVSCCGRTRSAEAPPSRALASFSHHPALNGRRIPALVQAS